MPDSAPSKKIKLAALETLVFRAPVETPVRTSFGTMYDRPAVLVRVVAEDGSEFYEAHAQAHVDQLELAAS